MRRAEEELCLRHPTYPTAFVSLRCWVASSFAEQAGHTPPTGEDVAAARVAQDYSRAAFAQDFEIWANKRPALTILQVPTDGPYAKVRAWYKQFYHPRADAARLQQQANGVFTVRDMPSANARAA